MVLTSEPSARIKPVSNAQSDLHCDIPNSSIDTSKLTMSNFSASSATITAVAVFENGRRVQGQGMTLIFDAQMYLSSESAPLLAALRFFNSENRTFDEIGFYFVIARVSCSCLVISIFFMPYFSDRKNGTWCTHCTV
jgi:hypothetical protein